MLVLLFGQRCRRGGCWCSIPPSVTHFCLSSLMMLEPAANVVIPVPLYCFDFYHLRHQLSSTLSSALNSLDISNHSPMFRGSCCGWWATGRASEGRPNQNRVRGNCSKYLHAKQLEIGCVCRLSMTNWHARAVPTNYSKMHAYWYDILVMTLSASKLLCK